MGTSSRAAERKVILELTELLQKNAAKVLSGETKLCLTTSSLGILATNFRRYSENAADEASSSTQQTPKKKHDIDPQKWRDNIRVMYDFVIKVKALKIIHGSYTMKSPVQIARFSSVQVLEVKKLPIHMVEGLSRLRGQLREITVLKSIETLQDLLEICGGDRSAGLVWSNLKHAYLSFNSLKQLDASLGFIPFVEVMDLSHNSISNTGDFLKCLNDVMRINFSYNMLTSVPSFSSSNMLKLKTLVLRSNQLDNLSGIEELTALEELDVSDNFLIDHKVLVGLTGLNRLQVLCVTGNPLCYKSNHRLLTVAHVSPLAGLGVFLLDGRRLTPDEITVLKQNQYKAMQHEQHKDEVDNDSGSGTSEIAVSQLTPKKKKGHQRKRSMERIPKITDIEKSMMEENKPRSGGATPSMSFDDDSDIAVDLEDERKRYEILRAHYKEDWLKALTAEQTDSHTNTAGDATDNVDSARRDTALDIGGKPEKDVSQEHPKSEDRGKDPEQREVIEAEIKPMTSPTVTSPTSPKSLRILETTDIYTMMKSPRALPEPLREPESVRREKMQRFYSQTSHDSSQFSPDDTDDPSKYGEEGEPYIVMIPDDDMKPVLVTLNDRFIIEKDLNGQKQASLDLKCLLTVNLAQEKCEGSNIIGGLLFTVLTAHFDYVKKDSRQRKYAFEDETEAQTLESLLLQHIKPKTLEEEHWMECLKCHSEFRQSGSTETLPKCPRCYSKMVIRSDKHFNTASVITTKPDVSDTRILQASVEEDVKVDRRLGSNRFARKKLKMRRPDENESSSPGKYSSGSLKDYVDQQIIAEEENAKVDGPDKKAPEETIHTSANGSDTGLRNNTSWSDIHRSASQNRGPRDSVSSVESDITILGTNVSRSGLSASITESSHENTPSNPPFPTISENKNVVYKGGHMAQSDEPLKSPSGINWVKDGQGQITPVGSPLTTSICSSMISSVYENTLAGGGDENQTANNLRDNENLTGSSTDSVIIRRSRDTDQARNRSSENRHITMYDDSSVSSADKYHDAGNEPSSDAESVTLRRGHSSENMKTRNVALSGPIGALNVTLDSVTSRDSSITRSVYDTSGNDGSVPSIYDTAVSGYGLDSTKDDSASIHDSQDSSASHDLMTNNHKESSPLRRNKQSRDNLKQSKRSAIYSDTNMDESSELEQSTDMTDFPSHLSPIKRSGARKSRNRSAIVLDDSYEVSDHSVPSIEISDTSVSNSKLEETNESLASTGSSVLPWEREVSKPSGKDESLNHDEFVNIDHRVQLYLELKVFKADETAQCAIQCNIVQYSKLEEMKSLVVISTERIMIFRITGESTSKDDWLMCYEDQPITELQYIDIGLGYQTLRLEFNTLCSSYTLLIGDEGRCKQFLTLISDIVQRAASTEHSKLEGISKSNPSTQQNLTTQVIHCQDTPEPEAEPQTFIRYLMIKLLNEEPQDTDTGETMSLVVTTTDIILVQENHQWPLPRLQGPLSEDKKGRQFTNVQRERINNIESVMFNEYNPTELRVAFFEHSDLENARSVWVISMETIKGVKSLVDSIREPWEQEFGVSLDITSFSEEVSE